jgi:hypothetical protein
MEEGRRLMADGRRMNQLIVLKIFGSFSLTLH